MVSYYLIFYLVSIYHQKHTWYLTVFYMNQTATCVKLSNIVFKVKITVCTEDAALFIFMNKPQSKLLVAFSSQVHQWQSGLSSKYFGSLRLHTSATVHKVQNTPNFFYHQNVKQEVSITRKRSNHNSWGQFWQHNNTSLAEHKHYIFSQTSLTLYLLQKWNAWNVGFCCSSYHVSFWNSITFLLGIGWSEKEY